MLNLGYDADFPTISSNLGCKVVSSATANAIQMTFTVNDPINYVVSVGTGGVGASNITNIAINDCELVFDVLEFEEEPYQQLLAAHGNRLVIKSNVIMFGTSQTIEQGKLGTAQLGYTHELSSLKKIVWQCIPNDSWEKDFGGVNPNLDSWNIRIGNNPYPTMPIPIKYASEAYYQVSKSLGSIYSTGHSGTINRNVFAKSMTAYSDYQAYAKAADFVTDASANLHLVALRQKE
eukprot:scaffold6516_cov201-Ochromonas_danica.AAC.2